jgi:BMFP domain-containing protein YqiC
VKSKIHEEVESVVLKMGFIKREEFDALAAEVAALKKSTKGTPVKKKPINKSTVKKAAVKKAAKRSGAK